MVLEESLDDGMVLQNVLGILELLDDEMVLKESLH